jgi:hypothetical protein
LIEHPAQIFLKHHLINRKPQRARKGKGASVFNNILEILLEIKLNILKCYLNQNILELPDSTTLLWHNMSNNMIVFLLIRDL